MEQLTLDRARTLDVQFDEWVQTPHGREVYEGLIRRAWRLQSAGVNRYGAKAICEAMRFSYTVRRGPEAWKVNNNWTSRLARKAMREYPDLKGFFETRELRS